MRSCNEDSDFFPADWLSDFWDRSRRVEGDLIADSRATVPIFSDSGKFSEDLPWILNRFPHPRSTCFVLKEFRIFWDEHTISFVSGAA